MLFSNQMNLIYTIQSWVFQENHGKRVGSYENAKNSINKNRYHQENCEFTKLTSFDDQITSATSLIIS